MKLLLAIVIVMAFAVRFTDLESVGVSHWDAGTYTAAPFGVGPYGRHDVVPYYAPPLVPWLNAHVLSLAGDTDTSAIMIAAVFGVLSVIMLYILGRNTVGPTAALLGAACLAVMEFHVVYSRQPLADVTFTFFFTAALLALWDAATRGGLRHAASAGVWVSAALLTKYHGGLALVVFALLLLASGAPALVKERDRLAAGPGWRAVMLAGVLALVTAAILVLDIHSRMGLDSFLENRRQWVQDPALYLLPKTLIFVGNAVEAWVSPLVLVAAAAGLVAMLRRRTAGDVLWLIWALVFLAALPFYSHYPRLLVPLLPPLAMLAGVGMHAVMQAVRLRYRSPGTEPSTAVTAVLVVIVLLAGWMPTSKALDVSDRGYAAAGQWLRDQGPGEQPDLLVTQHALLTYLRAAPNGVTTYDEPGGEVALAAGRFRYLVADMRTLEAPEFRSAIAGLERVHVIPNPLPEPFLVNVTDFDTLAALAAPDTPRDLRDELTTIRIYRRPDADR